MPAKFCHGGRLYCICRLGGLAQEPAPAAAAVSFGTIVGLVTDAAKAPIGGATVTAIRAGGGIRSTISGSDGIYTFADVLPGLWSLTITVEGWPDVQVPSLNVVAGKATRHDIAMNIAVTPKPSAPVVALVSPGRSSPNTRSTPST